MSQDARQVLDDYEKAERALVRHELEWWCAPPNRQEAVHAVAGGADEHKALVEAVEALDAARELAMENNPELREYRPLERLLADLTNHRVGK